MTKKKIDRLIKRKLCRYIAYVLIHSTDNFLCFKQKKSANRYKGGKYFILF
jgi:hypothetical protein